MIADMVAHGEGKELAKCRVMARDPHSSCREVTNGA